MAMMNFESNTSQFNDTIKQLISLMMNQKLMKERMSGYKELEEMRGERGLGLEELRQEGDIALQGKRHGDATTQAQQKFYHDLAQDTEANQIKALIFTGKREGKDVTPLVGELSNRMKSVSSAVADGFQGVTSAGNIESMLNNLTDETLRKVFGVIGDERQRREVDVPRLGVEEYAAKTSRGSLAQKWAAMDVDNIKDQSEGWKSLITDAEDFLRQEGVKPEVGEEAAFGKLFEGSGKLPDPLSPENRGKALSWLTKIRMDLIDGKMPGHAERRFLEAVKNTFLIEGREGGLKGSEIIPGMAGEGMPTPGSQGFTPAEFGRQQSEAADRAKAEEVARIKERLIADALMKGYVTQEQVMGLDEAFQRRAEEVYALGLPRR